MRRILGLAVGIYMTCVSAMAGNELGNGGDSLALEFVSIGRALVEKLHRNPDPRIEDLDALKAAVEQARVVTRDGLTLAGAEVDAINYPSQKLIELNRSRWKGYDAHEKEALVLHEYLGIAGIDDSSYQISGSYARGSEVFPIASAGTNRFSLGLGSGYHHFDGNIGKLYSPTSPAFDLRAVYQLTPYLAGKVGVERSGYSFSGGRLGYVEVSLIRVNLSMHYNFLGSKAWKGKTGIDPYLLAGLDSYFRGQDFYAFNSMERDTAYGAGFGIGFAYHLRPRGLAFWAEGKANKILFRDRFEAMYASIGLADTTGNLYSGMAGVQYHF